MVTLGALFIELIFFFTDGRHEFTDRLVDEYGYRFVAESRNVL